MGCGFGKLRDIGVWDTASLQVDIHIVNNIGCHTTRPYMKVLENLLHKSLVVEGIYNPFMPRPGPQLLPTSSEGELQHRNLWGWFIDHPAPFVKVRLSLDHPTHRHKGPFLVVPKIH